ncbi:MAG TPA: protoporphyrinogen oxidase [Mycobacteriales bacterium]|nr:protoporphyrinogen oxidase [Mycobacteriales bacterium]
MGRRVVAVIGGGISGLACAHALHRTADPAIEVIVLEGSARVGGILHTSSIGGLQVDAGADAFLARVPEGERLAREVGLGELLVSPSTGQAYVWIGDRLRPIPEGTLLGVPGSWRSLASSRVLSPAGLLRAAADLVLPASAPVGDISVGELVRRRLGRQVVDRLVDPLLGGVYAGRADELSLESTVPQLAAAAHGQRSVMRVVRSRTAAAPVDTSPVFSSLDGGLGQLPQAIARSLGDAVRLSSRAALVERVGNAWRITLVGGRALVVDAVVAATPAPVASSLLRFAAPEVSTELAGVRTASVVVVTMALPRGALAGAPGGSGFLVPATEGRLMKACTFSSAKWAHLDRGDVTIVRCSVGRAGEPAPDDDDEIVARLLTELALAVGLTARPLEVRVSRWADALPQYAVGHRERIARVDAALAALPGLALAGSAYDGVGVPACIRSGEKAAATVLAHLRARPG